MTKAIFRNFSRLHRRDDEYRPEFGGESSPSIIFNVFRSEIDDDDDAF